MVPPERIELSTPPLPRVCSTPELRRHWIARHPTGAHRLACCARHPTGAHRLACCARHPTGARRHACCARHPTGARRLACCARHPTGARRHACCARHPTGARRLACCARHPTGARRLACCARHPTGAHFAIAPRRAASILDRGVCALHHRVWVRSVRGAFSRPWRPTTRPSARASAPRAKRERRNPATAAPPGFATTSPGASAKRAPAAPRPKCANARIRTPDGLPPASRAPAEGRGGQVAKAGGSPGRAASRRPGDDG